MLTGPSFNLTPRVFPTEDGVVYLFDNETGATQKGLVLVLRGDVNLVPSDITAFGGGAATLITRLGEGAILVIEIEVVAWGTIQINFAGDNAAGSICSAWFSRN